MGIVAIVLSILSLIVPESVLLIGTTERAVIFNTYSGTLSQEYEPGVIVVIPGIQRPIIYDVSQQIYTLGARENSVQGEDAISTRSLDGHDLLVDLTLVFNIDPTQVYRLHTNWPLGNYVDGFVAPIARSAVRDAVVIIQAEEIYRCGRTMIQQQIYEALVEQFRDQGLQLGSISVNDIIFSETFIETMEANGVDQQCN